MYSIQIILITCQGNYFTAIRNAYIEKKNFQIYLSYNSQNRINELSIKAPSKTVQNSELFVIPDWS